MKKTRRKLNWSSCFGRRSQRYQIHEEPFECFYIRRRKKDVLESWPTSPVLHSEERNTREKEKAHKFYERQLKASSWYLQPSQRCWIEIVEPTDGADTCSECCYEDACGCVLVSNHGDNLKSPKGNGESGRSSFGFCDTLSVESARASGVSKTSTEDEKSYYDNLCQFCKITSLERRARKYGEWRRRFSAKLAEARLQEEAESGTCTCAMDNLSFIEWKKIYEQEELVKLSKADPLHEHDQIEVRSTSDYGTQKSKDSNSTAVYRDYPSMTVKSSSLGYNSLSSIPYTERDIDTEPSSTSTDASDSEESGNAIGGCAVDVRTTRPRLRPAWTSHVTHDSRDERYDDEVFGAEGSNSLKLQRRSQRRKTRRYKNSFKTKAYLHNVRPKIQDGSEEIYEGLTIHPEEIRTCFDDKGCVTPNDTENLAKIPMENDETFPADFLSEFLMIAQTIDEFYESIHARKFLENRILTTSRDRVQVTTSSSDLDDMTSNQSVIDRTTTAEFSAELRKRIRSLERLCSFVDYSDEDQSETGGSILEDVKDLGNAAKEEEPVWRLSQQSINLTLTRRSRSNTSGDSASGRSRCASNSGSGSSNSRCSTRQGNRTQPKPSITSVENIRSPDSGFSEHTDSLSGINSPDACQLGAKWAGSMQWDYSDWEFYYGVGCHDVHDGQFEVSKDHSGLMTIDESPARPQDPLDWDWDWGSDGFVCH